MNHYNYNSCLRILKNNITFNACKNKDIKSKNHAKNNIKNKMAYFSKVNHVQKYNFSTFNNLPVIFNDNCYGGSNGGGGGGGGGGPSSELIIAAIVLSIYSAYKRY